MSTNKWLAGYILVSTLAIAALAGYAQELRHQKIAAQASAATAALEAAGWKKAAQAAPKEVIKTVPELVTKEVVRYIKEGVVQPVAAVSGETTSNVVQIPCPPSTPKGASDFTIPALVKLKGSLLVLDAVEGTVLWNGKLSGQIQSPAGAQPVWSQNLVFDPENTDLNITLSDKIHKALAAYDKPWVARHLRWQCPGVGAMYGIDGKVSVGVSCTYGLTW